MIPSRDISKIKKNNIKVDASGLKLLYLNSKAQPDLSTTRITNNSSLSSTASVVDNDSIYLTAINRDSSISNLNSHFNKYSTDSSLSIHSNSSNLDLNLNALASSTTNDQLNDHETNSTTSFSKIF